MITIRQPILNGVSWSSAIAAALLGLVFFMSLSMIGLAVAGESLEIGNFSGVGFFSLMWLLFSVAVTGYVTGAIAVKAAPGLTTKRAGLLCGSVAGSLLLLVITMYSYNVISSTVRTALRTAGAVTSGAARLAGDAATAGASQVGEGNLASAAERVGLGEEYQAVTSGFDRQDLESAIAEASPELSQAQVSATGGAVTQVLDQARQNITTQVNDISQLVPVVREQWRIVQQQLTGPQFVSRLQQQGLAPAQAQEVSRVIADRVNQMEQRAQQALNTLERQADKFTEIAGTTVSRGALIWLAVAGLLVGLAALAGWLGNDEHMVEAEQAEEHNRQAQAREADEKGRLRQVGDYR